MGMKTSSIHLLALLSLFHSLTAHPAGPVMYVSTSFSSIPSRSPNSYTRLTKTLPSRRQRCPFLSLPARPQHPRHISPRLRRPCQDPPHGVQDRPRNRRYSSQQLFPPPSPPRPHPQQLLPRQHPRLLSCFFFPLRRHERQRCCCSCVC